MYLCQIRTVIYPDERMQCTCQQNQSLFQNKLFIIILKLSVFKSCSCNTKLYTRNTLIVDAFDVNKKIEIYFLACVGFAVMKEVVWKLRYGHKFAADRLSSS